MTLPGKSDEDGCGLPRVIVVAVVTAMLLGGCGPARGTTPQRIPTPPPAGPVGTHEDDPRPGTVVR